MDWLEVAGVTAGDGRTECRPAEWRSDKMGNKEAGKDEEDDEHRN